MRSLRNIRVSRSGGRVDLADTWRQAFALPDRRPIWQWAPENIALPPGLTRRDFDPTLSRHFLPIFDALQDDYVRQVVIRKPLRGGGTLISDIWHCWTRANDPGPAMAILQSDEMAQDHFQDRLRWMMTRSSALRVVLPTGRHSITNSEIKFSDGLPLYVTGPGINNLQTKGLRYISLDEVWLYKAGTVVEAEGRLGDFTKVGLSKLLLISQGSTEDDDFDRRDKEGSCEEWEVACAKCGGYFQPCWSHEVDSTRRGMRWDEHKDSKGNWDVPRCLETVRYECPLCGHGHPDGAPTRAQWNATGHYVVTNPSAPRSKRSFHWPGVIDWPWVNLVEFYLLARNAYRLGLIEPTVQFWQKYMAEPKSEKTVLNENIVFRPVAQLANSPDDVARVLCNDRQSEGLYWSSCHVITKDGTVRCVWFGKLFGGAALKAKADELHANNVLIDSGFEAKGPQGVYALCALHHTPAQRWIATKGAGEKSFWHVIGKGRRVMRSYSTPERGDPEIGTAREGQAHAIVVRMSSDVFDERLDFLIANGKFQVQTQCTEEELKEYKRQLSARYKKRKVDKFSGKVEYIYVTPSGNDHLRDCAKMAVLAAIMAGVLPDQDLTG